MKKLKKLLNILNRRLPQTGKTVELNISGNETAVQQINSELFEWVLENLIKNALDAIEGHIMAKLISD